MPLSFRNSILRSLIELFHFYFAKRNSNSQNIITFDKKKVAERRRRSSSVGVVSRYLTVDLNRTIDGWKWIWTLFIVGIEGHAFVTGQPLTRDRFDQPAEVQEKDTEGFTPATVDEHDWCDERNRSHVLVSRKARIFHNTFHSASFSFLQPTTLTRMVFIVCFVAN